MAPTTASDSDVENVTIVILNEEFVEPFDITYGYYSLKPTTYLMKNQSLELNVSS